MVKASQKTKGATSHAAQSRSGVHKTSKRLPRRPPELRFLIQRWRRRRSKKPVTKSTGEGQPSSPNQSPSREQQERFLSTGRTGRRNAMSDPLNPGLCNISTAGLPLDLGRLGFAESNLPTPEIPKESSSADLPKPATDTEGCSTNLPSSHAKQHNTTGS